jgi:hypothetical protein
VLENLEKLIAEQYVTVQKHQTAKLFIYNYTAKCQYEGLWNDTTLRCRGLILDEQGNVVSQPFKKFFNLEEHSANEIPLLPFEVYEKLDGSLGILYWLDEKPMIATRGSFHSEQAIKATAMLHAEYAHTFDKLRKDCTYLFEIIYPQNKIVVDYGKHEQLILLAMIDKATGLDLTLPLENIGFPQVKKYDGLADLQALKELNWENSEGFVIKFQNSFRLKIKFADYIRLHRIMTGISNKMIWEYLKDNKSFEDMLNHVPDEFYKWVKHTMKGLEDKYAAIEQQCKQDFRLLADRKTTALYFQTCQYPNILFAMYDQKNYAPLIWKMLKPAFEKAYKVVEE